MGSRSCEERRSSSFSRPRRDHDVETHNINAISDASSHNGNDRQCECSSEDLLEQTRMGRGQGWTGAQNAALSTAWVQSTERSDIGTSQSSQQFWESVKAAYEVESKGDKARSWRACQTRFNHISACTQKFSGCYSSAEDMVESGRNDKDIMNCALQIFAVDAELAEKEAREKRKTNKKSAEVNFNFEFVNCWEILRLSPKFQELCKKGGTAVEQAPESEIGDSVTPGHGNPSSNTPPGGSMYGPGGSMYESRPIGCKRSKKEQYQSKVQEKLITFMDDKVSTSSEVRGYLKILTGALLVAICDEPPTEQQREFLANANNTIFSSQAPAPPPVAPPPSVPAQAPTLVANVQANSNLQGRSEGNTTTQQGGTSTESPDEDEADEENDHEGNQTNEVYVAEGDGQDLDPEDNFYENYESLGGTQASMQTWRAYQMQPAAYNYGQAPPNTILHL